MAEPKRLRNATDKNDQSEAGQLFETHDTSIADGGRFLTSLGENPTNHFPPEVLEIIFKNVESPKDLLSCWYTTPAWRSALQTTDFYFKMTLPIMLPHLTRTDLLRCSSVSKSWNASVDACIQSAEEFETEGNKKLKEGQQIVLKLHSRNMTEFIQRFQLSTNDESGGTLRVANAVAFRRVEVKLYRLQPLLRLPGDQCVLLPAYTADSKNLLKCLDYHGHLIQNMHLDIEFGLAWFSDQLKLIRNCLERTPNLRVLHITATDDTREKILSKRDLETFNSKNAWPVLKHLKELTFGYRTDREELAGIANAHAPQLVNFHFGIELVEPYHRPLTNRFSCLQKIVYQIVGSCSAMEFGAFVKSSQCPLRDLSIMFRNSDSQSDKRDDENYDGLVMAANYVSGTLKLLTLDLICDEGVSIDINKFEQLRLPKLQLFKVSGFSYPSPDFLQIAFPALILLSLKSSLSDSKRWEGRELGKIYADLYSEHQFWKKLPDIQVIHVECMLNSEYVLVGGEREGLQIRQNISGGYVETVYTRQAYEAKLKMDRAV